MGQHTEEYDDGLSAENYSQLDSIFYKIIEAKADGDFTRVAYHRRQFAEVCKQIEQKEKQANSECC